MDNPTPTDWEIEWEEANRARRMGLDKNLQGDVGVKESSGKLTYDIDWEFIEAMAKRMQENKDKYPRDNWKKPIDIIELKDAITRHFMEVMKGNYEDETKFGHLVALADNAMMLRYQLKHND